MPELCAMAATSPPVSARPKPIILEPFDRRESMWRAEFCAMTGLSSPGAPVIVNRELLGRRIGKRWHISRVLTAMYMDGNREAMRAYWSGSRTCSLVAPYFLRFGIDPTTLGRGVAA